MLVTPMCQTGLTNPTADVEAVVKAKIHAHAGNRKLIIQLVKSLSVLIRFLWTISWCYARKLKLWTFVTA
jgi:hypothetical protein